MSLKVKILKNVDLACVKLRRLYNKNEGNVAGVILEPKTGTNRCDRSSKRIHTLIKITRENDAPLITDEAMTGWGRVGERFAVNLWGVRPDILTTA